MEERQENISVKIENGVEVARLPPGVPRVTGLGEKHLDEVQELAKVAKLSVEDFATMLDHLPLYLSVVQQLDRAEKNRISPSTIMEQINEAFTRDDASLENDNSEEPLDSRDNVYEYDGFVVPDSEAEEESSEPEYARKRKRSVSVDTEMELDALDIAEYKLKLKRAKLMVKKYKKKLGIKKRRYVRGNQLLGHRNNPIIL